MMEQVNCMLAPLYSDSLNMITSVKATLFCLKMMFIETNLVVQQRGSPSGGAGKCLGADQESHTKEKLLQVDRAEDTGMYG